MGVKLGLLREVKVRDLWQHEQYHFSNWLAEEENTKLLNEILGLTLIDIEKEAFVGSYRCDLFAKDETSGARVIIENQLETSNHDHLGKVITYASGLEANVIVWIVTQARDEHRSAIQWLNNNTGDDLSFFLIELHAYRIGDSLPAPKFEIIAKPNGFIKYSKRTGGSSELSSTESQRLAFWTLFNETLIEMGRPFNDGKATTNQWYNVSIGTSKACISINLIHREGYITVEYYIKNDKALFDTLYVKKDEIETKLGFSFDWRRIDNKKASRISSKIPGLNFENQSNYKELIAQTINRVIAMKNVIGEFIK